ncbi:MAG: diacylglycerol kinase family lipid kinase [Deltaproteobacteria bacterium]|nr:diacylglycerol kinase family lipid kinase [Deltaproteobacteria bacterium]
MSLHAYVIVNPASANGGTARRWPEIRAALDRVLSRWDHAFTTGPGDATTLARGAVKDGYEMIVSVGGDGTMNEVVNGLFPDQAELPSAPIRSGVVIAPVRQGTGGDFARFLGLRGDVPSAVAHLAGDVTRPCDLGLLAHQTLDGAPAWRAFLNIASFGLSGLVDEKVNRSTKAFGGRVSFLSGLVRALAEYRPQAVRMTVDDQLFLEGPMVIGAVANGQYFGGGMHFAPEAAIDDGLFDVAALLRVGAREIASIGDLYSGKLTQWQSFIRTRGVRLEVEGLGPTPVLLDVDGEQPGKLPASFRLLPSAVRLKVA